MSTQDEIQRSNPPIALPSWKVAADAAYQNARANTPHTAGMALDQALNKAMLDVLQDDTEVYKQFVQNPSFKRL